MAPLSMGIRTYAFRPAFSVVAKLPEQATIGELEREVGVYSATPEFLRKHCGPVANRILDAVPDSYYDEAVKLGLLPNVDVRIHRLYPGDYPAYPGWHCDGEFRETYFAQPDLERIKVSRHLTCTVSSAVGGVSNTQFLGEPFLCTVDDTNDVALWGKVHAAVEAHRVKNSMRLYDTRDGELVLFDSWTLHRCRPARVRGWRLFFRMSMWHRPHLGEGGMVTKQEQVYKVLEGGGW